MSTATLNAAPSMSTLRPIVSNNARSLLVSCPCVTPEQTNSDVFELFIRHPNMVGMPVVEGGIPIGLINRNLFLEGIAKPFHKEVYGRKSCIAFMDKNPLVVDASTSIQDLSFQVADAGGKTLADGFIIIEHGQYAGMGLAEDLVRAITNLQAEKNRMVMESIDYASVIQKSFVRTSREEMAQTLADYFLHWEPRDLVGGDYYYFSRFDDGFFLGIMDCTGHGVPGAFMTLIMASYLDHTLIPDVRNNPAEVLSRINRMVKSSFGNQSHRASRSMEEDDGEQQSDDGMDAAFVWVDTRNHQLTYAGAKLPIFWVAEGDSEVNSLDGDRSGVGYVATPNDFSWSNQQIDLKSGTCVYIATDGVWDQIGGAKQIAFGKRRLRQLLLENFHKPMAQQQQRVLEAFYEYQGNQPRRDDVTLFGFRA